MCGEMLRMSSCNRPSQVGLVADVGMCCLRVQTFEQSAAGSTDPAIGLSGILVSTVPVRCWWQLEESDAIFRGAC
jgi:hypothetical protein